MKFLRSLAADLGDKRLWPVIAVLVLCAVAIPVGVGLTTSSPSAKPGPGLAPLPAPPAGTPAPGKALETIAGPGTPKGVHYRSTERDPFRSVGGSASGASATRAAIVKTATAAAPSTTGKTGSSTATTTTKTTTAPKPRQTRAVTPPRVARPKAVPARLKGRQTYSVTLSVKSAAGAASTVENLPRLSILPGPDQPALVYLGVLQGGGRALFLVEPGALVGGPGTCVPSPLDCQVLALSKDQIEGLAVRTGNSLTPVALFSVAAIKVVGHSSRRATLKVRRRESAPGRSALNNSNRSALGLFGYRATLGAVVDLRKLLTGSR